MQFELSLRDSEVARVTPEGEALVVDFSAAAVSRLDVQPPEAGYMSGLQLRLTHTRWKGVPGECIGRLAGGELRVGEAALARLSLPWHTEAALSGELHFANGATLRFVASDGECRLPEDPRFQESLACWV